MAVALVQTPKLKRLYDDWQARRRGREFPARSDFDILDLEYVAGSLSMIDVFRDPWRFHFRVHAGNVTERIRFDLTGKDLDALPNVDYRENIRMRLMSAIERRGPIVVSNRHLLPDEPNSINEVLILPLSSDGETIDKLMSAVIWL